MIKHTFSILNGIGEKIERRLWSEGILSWEAFLDTPYIDGFSHHKKAYYDSQLIGFLKALEVSDKEYFSLSLRRREHWRLYDVWKGDVLCLDIETNGFMPQNGGYVTMVGLYDGRKWRALVRGENLTVENLKREIDGYKVLITFYGTVFDVPFLCRSFRGLRFNMPHYDICYAAKRLGIKGGLKSIEKLFGIKRDESVDGMDGYDAVRLWYEYRKGSKEAFELLLRYNREDTVNLYRLAELVYKRLRESTGIERYLQPSG
ncbi:MAG: exonuclease [Nitrospirae bacterium]|nr:exonuclease [Nitrospirota bacterium]